MTATLLRPAPTPSGSRVANRAVARWARRYPVFAVALALVAGGLVGHFFFATD